MKVRPKLSRHTLWFFGEEHLAVSPGEISSAPLGSAAGADAGSGPAGELLAAVGVNRLLVANTRKRDVRKWS